MKQKAVRSKMSLDRKVIFADTVFAQEVDGEMVLLDMQSENYFGLDQVGTVIWQVMQENADLKDVLAILLEQYDVKEDILKKDLLAFTASLEKSGLVTVEVL